MVMVLETTAATVSWVDLTGAWNVFNAARKGNDVITFIVSLIVHSPVGKLV